MKSVFYFLCILSVLAYEKIDIFSDDLSLIDVVRDNVRDMITVNSESRIAISYKTTTVTKMTIPNNKYNINAKLATTNMGEAILVLNTAYNASFDVNVLASLFNSGTISKAKYFKEVVVVNQPTDATCFGYILDPDAIILTNEKLETTSFYNPSNIVTTYWLHNWTKITINNAVNALNLVYKAQA